MNKFANLSKLKAKGSKKAKKITPAQAAKVAAYVKANKGMKPTIPTKKEQ